MGFRVDITNENKKYSVNSALIKRMAEKVLAEVAKKRNSTIEILFTGDKRIRVLNRKYKNSDRATDVLSFELGDCGSVAISLDRAAANAKVYRTSVEEEASLCVIHGILHLFGYDDEEPGKRRLMRAKESELLEGVCTKEVLSRVLTPR